MTVSVVSMEFLIILAYLIKKKCIYTERDTKNTRSHTKLPVVYLS